MIIVCTSHFTSLQLGLEFEGGIVSVDELQA